jgi:hypothetical protein
MSTSSTIEETEPQTIADLGGESEELIIKRPGGLIKSAAGIRKSAATRVPRLNPPPSKFESLQDDVQQLKETVEALRDAYNRHHHSNLDGSQTSTTSVVA